ncbi:MAG: hypothetical protein PVH96_10305 [Gemmatimonadota bacterium]|jgi:hypothetical protein
MSRRSGTVMNPGAATDVVAEGVVASTSWSAHVPPNPTHALFDLR